MLNKKKVYFISVLAASAALFCWASPEARWITRYLLSRDVSPGPADTPPRAELLRCDRCNLVLISMDTLRSDVLGFLNAEKKNSPHLDRIAQKSVVFTEAFANAFYTTPSHMTVFTSLYPQQHRVDADEVKVPGTPRGGPASALEARYRTLAETLRDAGYTTTWFGPLAVKHLDPGLGFARGFDRRFAPVFPRPIEQQSDARAHFKESEFTAALARDKSPQFIFLHSYVTHMPFVTKREGAPAELRADYLLGEVAKTIAKESDKDAFYHHLGQRQLRKWSHPAPDAAQVAAYRLTYEEQVRNLDGQIGEMWDALERSGKLKNTLVIFFSDHGTEFFEHGNGTHSSFYEHTIRVPLMIYNPKLPAGTRMDRTAELIDIVPTALNLLNVTVPVQAQGIDLLSAQTKERTVIGYSMGNSYARNRAWKLMRRFDGSEELFYLPLDPSEKTNLIEYANPWTKKAYAQLSRELLELETSAVP